MTFDEAWREFSAEKQLPDEVYVAAKRFWQSARAAGHAAGVAEGLTRARYFASQCVAQWPMGHPYREIVRRPMDMIDDEIAALARPPSVTPDEKGESDAG